MALLEDIKPNATIRGVLPNGVVTVVSVQCHGSAALELTYRDQSGRVGTDLLYRDREADLEIVAAGRPWSFDGDGALFRRVAGAQRIGAAWTERSIRTERRPSWRWTISTPSTSPRQRGM